MPSTLSKAWQPVNKEREKKLENNTFAFIVYICVLVFIINQHNGWKVLIYEIQIKKIHYASMSFLNGRWPKVLALEQFFLTVGQNNFGNKIPFVTEWNLVKIRQFTLNCSWKIRVCQIFLTSTDGSYWISKYFGTPLKKKTIMQPYHRCVLIKTVITKN